MKVGPENVAATMTRLGIKSPLKPVPSVGLGSSPVNLLELAGAYQPFVNGGKAIDPWAVTSVSNREGKVLATFKHEPKQVLTENVAWLMTHMLRGGFQEPDGTSLAMYSYNVFQGGRELGGKTGTSSDHADGWYVSVTTDLVTAAWTGNDDPSLHFRSGMTGEGSRTGLPIVGRFLERVFKDPKLPYAPERFPPAPKGLKTSWNCPTPWPKDTLDSTAIDSLAPSTVPPDGILF
jgi:penicillin-binding protein 1A